MNGNTTVSHLLYRSFSGLHIRRSVNRYKALLLNFRPSCFQVQINDVFFFSMFRYIQRKLLSCLRTLYATANATSYPNHSCIWPIQNLPLQSSSRIHRYKQRCSVTGNTFTALRPASSPSAVEKIARLLLYNTDFMRARTVRGSSLIEKGDAVPPGRRGPLFSLLNDHNMPASLARGRCSVRKTRI